MQTRPERLSSKQNMQFRTSKLKMLSISSAENTSEEVLEQNLVTVNIHLQRLSNQSKD